MRHQRASTSRKVFLVINFLVLGGFTLAVLLPVLNMIAVSFSGSAAVAGGQVSFWPVGFNLEAYKKMLEHPSFALGFRNAFIQTALGVVIGLFMLFICAYPLSKVWLKGRRFMMLAIIFSMLFFGSAGLIPSYLLINDLGLIDTVWAIVLPFCISPYYLMLVITFFRSIPESLEESAQIDGLGPIAILFRVVLPLSKPIIATMFMFLFVYYWNNWFNSMIYLNSQNMHPIMLIVRNVITGTGMAGESASGVSNLSAASQKAASIMVSTLPIMAIFPFAQRYFVKGVMLGSVKG